MELFETIRTRRSIRSYADKPVERELIEKVVEAGIFAPTGMNYQTKHFVVITDREKMQALAAAVAKAENLPASYNFYAPPVFILVADKKEDYNAMANCACAMQNMMLAAHGLGLGAVWVNQVGPASDDADVRALLDEMGLPSDCKVCASLAMGWPAGPAREIKHNMDCISWV